MMSPQKGSTSEATDSEPPLLLFVCRRNEGSSILAEAILRHLARGQLRAASAGDTAPEPVSACALECLAAHQITTARLHSKPWGQFFGRGRPPVHVLVTLCDAYAARVNWDSDTVHTVKAHWPTPEPELVVGRQIDKQLAYEQAFVLLETRIRKLLALPLDRLSAPALSHQLVRIGAVFLGIRPIATT